MASLYKILKELCERTSLDKLHPVGSIYMSMDSTDPKTLFGGGDSVTWTRIQGRFLLGAGANTANSSDNPYGVCNANAINRNAGEQGGEVSHQLSEAEMPKHAHNYTGAASTNHIGVMSNYSSTGAGACGGAGSWSYRNNDALTAARISGVEKGGNGYHNNMPPYLAVYMWRRVS